MQTTLEAPKEEPKKFDALDFSRQCRQFLQELRVKAKEEMQERMGAAAELGIEWTQEMADNVLDPRHEMLLRYPRLIAHLICESLGYFCPKSAAMALIRYKEGEPMWCEWYCHMAQWDPQTGKLEGCKGATDEEKNANYKERLRAIGKRKLAHSFEARHSHKGYMAEYWRGRVVCCRELNGNGPIFASWF